ncbi:hypothetical protein PMAYCL1PPCAC_06655, partial [Pristionchus mayeri]
SPLSESDDSMSEATQLFNIKMEKDFMKAFPLRSDQRTSMGPPTSAVKGNSTFGKTPLMRGTAPLSTPHSTKLMTASTPIRFSLDETFVTGATAQNLSSKVAELTTELDLHKRKLERQSKELATTVDRMERYKVEADELIRDNTELKKTKQRLEEDLRGVQLMGNSDNCMNDSYSTVVSKLYTWLEWKDSQMNTMAALMASARLWTEENRALVANSFRAIEQLVISQDQIIALASGSVQDFHGIHESPIAEVVEEEETNPNDTTIRDNNESVYMDESVTEEMKDTSMNKSSRILPIEDELESILDNTMHEKDEKIDRLEFELNKALEQVELYKGRTTRLAVLEEKKESLEHRLRYLEELHDQSIRDLHASTRLCEDQLQLTSPEGKKMERDETRSLVQTMRNMQRKIDEWEEAYRQTQRDTQRAVDEAAAAKEEAAVARATAERVTSEASTLETENTALMAQLEAAKEELERVSRVEMTPLVNETLPMENAPTDAGDTTQIVHFHFNPLDLARKELRDEQERKRQSGEGEGPSAKRSRSEDDAEIEELKKKLQNAESRCERLSNHNIDSVRTFRHILLKVTGYDIKMKQEDSVQLTSVYDTLNQHFGFMVHDGRVEMIELVDKPYDGPDRFKEEAELWMGQHNSVPAFLAACQLKLFEEALVEPEETLMYGNGEDEMDPSAGPSFSVLQED